MPTLNLSSNKSLSEESRLKAFLWPNLKTQPGIDSVIDLGKIAAFVIAGLTCLGVLLKMAPMTALFDAAIFVALGFGIRKKSRICSVLAFVLYMSSQVLAFANGQGSWNLALIVIFAFLFINAIRGSFVHNRLKKAATQLQEE
jgi:hypothetical protein